MKLAISNLAWKEDDKDIFDLLKKYDVKGIEIAPGKVFGVDLDVESSTIVEYKNNLNKLGFEIPALQSIIFGHPEFQMFDETTHKAFYAHLEKVAKIANLLGAKVCVFGAPKNRTRNGKDLNIAIDFFKKAGDIFKSYGVILGLEPNTAKYHCDFMTTNEEAYNIVDAVAHDNVKFHFDLSTILLNGEPCYTVVDNMRIPCHFHVSAPYLSKLSDFDLYYKKLIDAIYARGYTGWVSIEMKSTDPIFENIENSLKKLYGI